tara:strand:- start:1062 stop:1859 length:798 start_codon:yes stop_codon:yes gene_type:complete
MAVILKRIARVCFFASIGAVLGFIAQYNINNITRVPTQAEITHLDNNARHVLVSRQDQIIHKSRSSAVRILSISDEDGSVASSSGTYTTMFKHYYVITTRHGIIGDCEGTKIVVDDDLKDCVKFIELNNDADYAIIQIEKLEDRSPIEVPKMVATTKKDWMRSLSIMSRTYYTGFPNNMGPLTIDGKIVGHHPEGFVYMDSYAWHGSSGSGVFSETGKYIGYVIALDVGHGITGPEIIENIVLVVPAYRINWLSALNSLEEERNQ